ncbi:MAG: PilZ domain-containing protein [Oceanospirillaceae bacterium]|nr:PilZ domain-containing protein [Oceanospirillaceae bacterium]
MEMVSPRRKLALDLLGFIEGKSLIVSAPKRSAGYSAANLEGVIIKVHIMLEGRICTFMSRVIKILPKPLSYWHLSYPKNIEVSNIRKNTRVELKLPVSIEFQDPELALKKDIPNIVFCTDVSMRGVGIDAPSSLGNLGDEFFVTLRLKIVGIDQMLLTSVVLRSCKMSEPGVYTHGFEFQNLEDESKVLIAAYVYKEMLIKLGYVDE